jgi:hypothetical protein
VNPTYIVQNNDCHHIGFIFKNNTSEFTGNEHLKFSIEHGANYVKTISNASYGTCFRGTDYMCYNDRSTTVFRRWNIVDMNDPTTIVDTFTIESGYLASGSNCVGGSIAFGNYVYIRAKSPTNKWNIFVYDRINKTLKISNFDYDINYTTAFSKNRNAYLTANTDCLVMQVNNELYCISKDDTLNCYKLNESKVEDHTTVHLEEIQRDATKSQLILICDQGYRSSNSNANGYTSRMVLDIGVWLKEKAWPKGTSPKDHFKNMNTTTQGVRSHALFMNNGIISHANGSSGRTDEKQLAWYPIESWLPHKIKGRTHCITAFNNPILIGGKSWTVSVTNDMHRLSDSLNNDGAHIWHENTSES